MENFNGVFFYNLRFGEALAVVEVDEVGGSVVLTPLSAFGAVSGEMPHFSALEAGVRRVPCGGRVALEVALWAIPLVAVGVLSSSEVISSIVSPVVPSGWCPVPIYVHWDQGVVHPPGRVRQVILWHVLSLRATVIPLGAWLLGGKGSKVSISSEYVSE